MNARDTAPVFTMTELLREHIAASGRQRVVLANGCFDPLHVGHVRYLQDAARHGDFLVVAMNDDAGTHALKGAGRPVMAEADRAAIVAALDMVGAVLLFSEPDVVGILHELKPAVHAKGTDYTVETVPEREIAIQLGIETVITGDPKSHASSAIVKQVRRNDRS